MSVSLPQLLATPSSIVMVVCENQPELWHMPSFENLCLLTCQVSRTAELDPDTSCLPVCLCIDNTG
jgi:hypothetical protein